MSSLYEIKRLKHDTELKADIVISTIQKLFAVLTGQQLSEELEVPFLPSDFKKKNGYKRSVELSKEYDLYRQDYCGCIFSKAERENGYSSHSSQTLAVGLRKNMI